MSTTTGHPLMTRQEVSEQEDYLEHRLWQEELARRYAEHQAERYAEAWGEAWSWFCSLFTPEQREP